MKITPGRPVVVAEGTGHLWFPALGVFSPEDLVVSFSCVPDAHGVLPIGAHVTSHDGGRTWGEPCWLPYACGYTAFPLDEDLVCLPYRWSCGDQERANMLGHLVTLGDRGESYRIDKNALRVEGLPSPMGEITPGEAGFVADSNVLHLPDGRFLTTLYGTFAGDDEAHAAERGEGSGAGYSLLAIESVDFRTWRYVCTIADWRQMPEAPEGPDEASLVQLANGDLMVVFRVGMMEDWPLRRCLSHDAGRTWSEPEALPAFSVQPSMIRTASGALVLSTGRPGLYVWWSEDGHGEDWQSLNIVEHHDEALADPRYAISRTDAWNRFHTTSYTSIRETEPGRLLMVYDRIPCDWNPVPADSEERNQIFALELTID